MTGKAGPKTMEALRRHGRHVEVSPGGAATGREGPSATYSAAIVRGTRASPESTSVNTARVFPEAAELHLHAGHPQVYRSFRP